MTMVSFDDLEGDLNEGGTRAPKAGAVEWTNPCPKCRGTGQFRGYSGRVVGACHMCKGSGKLTFKTSPEQRQRAAASRAKGQATKAANKAQQLVDWCTSHTAEHEWMVQASARGFGFATTMLEKLAEWGSLTDGQLAAVQKCMTQDAERAVAQEAKREVGRGVDVSRIAELFATARGNALKKPVLRVGELELALASERGKNPGAIYVRRPADDTYLGKIVEGVYEASFKAGAADIETLKATAANPLELAIAYGRRTGNCACCGRTLTNKESVELGIGPICRSKWGM